MLMAFQLLFPGIVALWSIGIVTYYAKSGAGGGGMEKAFGSNMKKKWELAVKLSIMFTLSSIFSCYTFLMSTVAVDVMNNIDDSIQKWYKITNSSGEIKTLYGIPSLILVQDSIVLFVLFVLFIIAAALRSIDWWCVYCAYSIVFPLVNISIHATSILISFIHDQQHAISTGIFYAILVIVLVQTMRVFASFLETQKTEENSILLLVMCVGFFVFSVIIILTFIFIFSICVIIPINNAYDELPARLQLIYNSILLAIAAGFTYWFIRKRKKEPREVTLSGDTLANLAGKKEFREVTLSEDMLIQLAESQSILSQGMLNKFAEPREVTLSEGTLNRLAGPREVTLSQDMLNQLTEPREVTLSQSTLNQLVKMLKSTS